MNQSILFPDLQSWDEKNKVIVFPAQQAGSLIECTVTASTLENMSGKTILTENLAIQVFSELRFDLEELAEELIEEEEFDSSGKIQIKG